MFGGGAGHIADMSSRMKQNRELLKRKRYFKRHLNAGDLDFYDRPIHKLKSTKSSKKQLQKIRQEADIDQRKQAIKRAIILFVSAIITLGILFLLNRYY